MTVEAGSIVVGVDGSDASSRALDWALHQAVTERRAITLVHAIHSGTPVLLDPEGDDPREARRMALIARGNEVLASVRHGIPGLHTNVDVHELVRIGDPREVLLELSETASMLVVGSRGMGPVRSLLLGSTSVAVVRHAHCPVVVHRLSPPPTPHDEAWRSAWTPAWMPSPSLTSPFARRCSAVNLSSSSTPDTSRRR